MPLHHSSNGGGITLNAPPPFFEWRGHKKVKNNYVQCMSKKVAIKFKPRAATTDTTFTRYYTILHIKMQDSEEQDQVHIHKHL